MIILKILYTINKYIDIFFNKKQNNIYNIYIIILLYYNMVN